MAKTSSDVCDWMPTVCSDCGKKIRKPIDSFMAHYDHTTQTASTICAACLHLHRA